MLNASALPRSDAAQRGSNGVCERLTLRDQPKLGNTLSQVTLL